jgi:hypothetical protein
MKRNDFLPGAARRWDHLLMGHDDQSGRDSSEV